MTEIILLKIKNHELTQQEMEGLINKHKNGVINNFDYDMGYLAGRLGDNGLKEFNNLLTGYLLLGVKLANEEKVRVKVKTLKNVDETTSYLG